jgi:hypothetical protein
MITFWDGGAIDFGENKVEIRINLFPGQGPAEEVRDRLLYLILNLKTMKKRNSTLKKAFIVAAMTGVALVSAESIFNEVQATGRTKKAKIVSCGLPVGSWRIGCDSGSDVCYDTDC